MRRELAHLIDAVAATLLNRRAASSTEFESILGEITLLEDPARRREMGVAGREMVEREYNWQTILDKWVTTYEKARDCAGAVLC